VPYRIHKHILGDGKRQGFFISSQAEKFITLSFNTHWQML